MRSVNPNTGIKGMDIVLANLNREILKIQGRSTKGLIEGTIIVRRDMDDTPPLIPIDKGNLRSSWFVTTATRIEKGMDSTFEGKNASELATDHSTAMSEYKSIAAAIPMPVVIMGFTANYSMWVHEMVDANFTGNQSKIKLTKSGKVTQATKKYTRRSGAGAKFLEYSLKRNQKLILQTIGTNAYIKK